MQYNPIRSTIKSFFKFDERQATWKKEIIGGLSTFLAMMYILSVNPSMLAKSDGLSGVSDPTSALFLGTALSSMLATLLMGLFANVPVALAPGMGINAFFTFTVASQSGFDLGYYGALICVFISGMCYAIIAITPLRSYFNKVLTHNIKIMMSAIIGFFLCYVGINNIGITNSVHPFSEFGQNFSPSNNPFYPIVIIGTIALVIGIVLVCLKIKSAIIITSLAAFIMIAIAYGVNHDFTINGVDGHNAFQLQTYNFSDFSTMFKTMFDADKWSYTLSQPIAYVAIFTFLYVDFFDTSSTLIAFNQKMQLETNNQSYWKDNWIAKANYVDGVSTVGGSLLLCSSVTVVSESFSGINYGAKTGFASIITSLMFLLSIAIWPIMGPFMPIGDMGQFQPVTGQAVFITGLMMIMHLKEFNWKKKIDIFVLIVAVVFGLHFYSISMGISWAIVLSILLYGIYALVVKTKAKRKTIYYEVLNPGMVVIGVLSLAFIIFDVLRTVGVI